MDMLSLELNEVRIVSTLNANLKLREKLCKKFVQYEFKVHKCTLEQDEVRIKTTEASKVAAVEFRLERSVRIRTLHSRVSMLQELHRRRLVATRSLPQWKTMTQVFTECLRHRACLSSLVHFSGYGVNFCMQRNFFEWDHMTYWISCALDRKRYMAVRNKQEGAARITPSHLHTLLGNIACHVVNQTRVAVSLHEAVMLNGESRLLAGSIVQTVEVT
ncbi:hypothetical protein MRX96_015491 [Rhipicephalus microplus]